MKELQKYYTRYEDAHEDNGECMHQCTAIYIASEADAAFAEMRREHAEEIERLKAEHEQSMKRLQSAARTGMDAAHAISSHNLERARKLHNESKPEVIESERRANAILTEENERLRKQAERYEKLRFNIKAVRFADRDIEMREFDDLVDQLPAIGEASVEQQHGRVE